MARAIGVTEFLAKKFTYWDLSPEWKECLGRVASNFSMLVWGDSGNGKTRFVLELVKELARFGRVGFNCTEEGISLTMQEAFIEANLQAIAGRLLLIDRETYPEMVKRLKRQKSPQIVVINSLQHMRMTYEMWCDLKHTFRKKTFILISHANGREPRGADAQNIRYDVDIKLYVKSYVAYPVPSRYGGNMPFVIWPEAAQIDPRYLLTRAAKNRWLKPEPEDTTGETAAETAGLEGG